MNKETHKKVLKLSAFMNGSLSVFNLGLAFIIPLPWAAFHLGLAAFCGLVYFSRKSELQKLEEDDASK